jgi:hypothetical protein
MKMDKGTWLVAVFAFAGGAFFTEMIEFLLTKNPSAAHVIQTLQEKNPVKEPHDSDGGGGVIVVPPAP